MTCALCGRTVPALTVHHLVPKSKLKKGDSVPTVEICWDCHRQLHALFSLDELAREYNTLEQLRNHARMASFIKWVRRQDATKRVRVRR